MAENLWTGTPFAKLLSELNAPLCEAFKHSAAQYIDMSEKWAKKALEMGEKATAWAKDTPFAPMIEMQQTFSRQLIDTSTSLARRLWQVEGQPEEKPA
jgi:hypothetical protein